MTNALCSDWLLRMLAGHWLLRYKLRRRQAAIMRKLRGREKGFGLDVGVVTRRRRGEVGRLGGEMGRVLTD